MKRTGPRPENLEAWMLLSAPTGAAAAGPIPRKTHGSTAVMRPVLCDYRLLFRA